MTIRFLRHTGEFLKCATLTLGEGYKSVLLQGFKNEGHPVKPIHFRPCNRWVKDDDYLIDNRSKEKYLGDSPKVKRLKCLALSFGTPILHAISTVLMVANRIAKIVTFAHFWYPDKTVPYCFTARLSAWGKDLMKVIFAPIFYLGLELSVLYGLAFPYDGGKLYASLERIAFNRFILAPCFQPEATTHLGGGDINKRNVW